MKYTSQHFRNQSTETALFKVHNDICRMVDVHGAAMVLLLDLSAAFSTINYGMLLARLSSCFGINGKVLSWIRPYLLDRSQFVNVLGARSSKSRIQCGVTQGSVLGPLLFFILCTATLARLYPIGYIL